MPLYEMAVRHIGHASSSAVAGGACCRSWTGSGYASCFSESVGHAGGDPRCDVFNAVVASIVGGCPAMEETSQRNSNHSKRKEVQGRQESPQPGFDLLVGFPFPLGFFFRILVFFCVFFLYRVGCRLPRNQWRN